MAVFGGVSAQYQLAPQWNLTLTADVFVSEIDVQLSEFEASDLLIARYSVGVAYRF